MPCVVEQVKYPTGAKSLPCCTEYRLGFLDGEVTDQVRGKDGIGIFEGIPGCISMDELNLVVISGQPVLRPFEEEW